MTAKNFINETQLELKKVTWPDRPLVARASLIILFIVILSTAIVFAADMLFGQVMMSLRQL